MTSLTTLPFVAGIGLRAPHHRAALDDPAPAAWWEVHSENFFAESGIAQNFLQVIASRTPVSLHGVGASLGGVDELFEQHLDRLAALVERISPAAVSEHLCWSSVGDRHFNDLLPLPYTREALSFVVARIGRMQDRLRRPILIENVSSYVEWRDADFSEWDFLAEAARQSGCGILLDINNIYVSAQNHGFDPDHYLAAIPPQAVGEFHLAGYEHCGEGDDAFLVDTHGACVQAPVWALFEQAIRRFGRRPTLIEWDADIPALTVLQAEARQADRRLAASAQEPCDALVA